MVGEEGVLVLVFNRLCVLRWPKDGWLYIESHLYLFFLCKR